MTLDEALDYARHLGKYRIGVVEQIRMKSPPEDTNSYYILVRMVGDIVEIGPDMPISADKISGEIQTEEASTNE